MKNKTKSIRLPNDMIELLKEARKSFGFPMPSIVRKSINAALKQGVVFKDWRVTTTSTDSDSIKVSLTPDQAEIPGKVIAAYVNWYLQEHAETISSHKPFAPKEKAEYIGGDSFLTQEMAINRIQMERENG